MPNYPLVSTADGLKEIFPKNSEFDNENSKKRKLYIGSCLRYFSVGNSAMDGNVRKFHKKF